MNSALPDYIYLDSVTMFFLCQRIIRQYHPVRQFTSKSGTLKAFTEQTCEQRFLSWETLYHLNYYSYTSPAQDGEKATHVGNLSFQKHIQFYFLKKLCEIDKLFQVIFLSLQNYRISFCNLVLETHSRKSFFLKKSLKIIFLQALTYIDHHYFK